MSLLSLAAAAGGCIPALPTMAPNAAQFQMFQPAAKDIFGDAPTLNVLLEKADPFAHEASVFVPAGTEEAPGDEDSLYVTSNFIEDEKTKEKSTKITRVVLPRDGSEARAEEVDSPSISLPNGGINYEDGIVFCAQGNQNTSGGLAYMEAKPPFATKMLVTCFISRPFNSPNDVVAHKDGSLWFTDPQYGFQQKVRPSPKLPQQVYRFDPKTNSTRAMADGFVRPNGIAFNPDQTIVYVTDTGSVLGDGTTDETGPAHIYAYDLEIRSDGQFLTNRRVFAMADVGIPDGIKVDQKGNVYAGCGDGINVWAPGGDLLGKILVEDGAANFSFGRNGTLYILNEKKIWVAQLGSETKGALLNI